MKPLKLFWCSTPSGEEDYWAVGTSRNIVIAFFARDNDLPLEEVSAEEILRIPDQDRHLLDQVLPDTSDMPRNIDLKTLAHFGVQYNANFHVFYRNGRIFRPEGLMRALRRSLARVKVQKKLLQMS